MLIKEMMPVTRQAFSDFSKVVSEELLLQKLSMPQGVTSIDIHRDENGDVVGYVSMIRFEMSFLDRHCTIFLYGPACFYREFRKHSIGVSFTFAIPFKYQIEHPETECYYFGGCSNPSSYLATIGHADTGWPHHAVDMPDIVKAFIDKTHRFLYGVCTSIGNILRMIPSRQNGGSMMMKKRKHFGRHQRILMLFFIANKIGIMKADTICPLSCPYPMII